MCCPLVCQEGKVSVWFSLHGEFDIDTDVTEVVEEVTQLFRIMKPDEESVVTEKTSGLLGHPTECHLLKMFHEEVGNDRRQRWAHDDSVRRLVELVVEIEETK